MWLGWLSAVRGPSRFTARPTHINEWLNRTVWPVCWWKDVQVGNNSWCWITSGLTNSGLLFAGRNPENAGEIPASISVCGRSIKPVLKICRLHCADCMSSQKRSNWGTFFLAHGEKNVENVVCRIKLSACLQRNSNSAAFTYNLTSIQLHRYAHEKVAAHQPFEIWTSILWFESYQRKARKFALLHQMRLMTSVFSPLSR